MIITRIWKQQPGEFFCISTKDPKNGKWHDHFFQRDELDNVQSYIREHHDKNVYFCPHGFKNKRRVKESAVLPKLLWSDMDEADPRKVKLPPSIAIESSPKRYVGLWLLDRTMSEDVNRRLAYTLGGDRSGWDLSQVLRVPGSINYKYPSQPRAKIVWGDHDEWRLADIEAQLPKEAVQEEYDSTQSSELYKKYERKFTAFARRCLMQKTAPPEGKRSEVFMRLVHECQEAGMSKSEGCTILKGSVWNKYTGRRDEDRQISNAWAKAINSKLKAEGVGEIDEADAPVPMTAIKPKEISWLWWPRLAQNAVNIIAGEGGVGKGIICCDLAARVTTGSYFPCSKERIEPASVLWGEGEDDVSRVVIPRLMANNADPSRVFFTTPSKFVEYDIASYVKERKIRLIVLSPLISFLEGLEDANAQLDTRHALEHLDSVIQDTSCAIVGIMHRNKKKDVSAIERVMGSVEFVNFARNVLLVDVEDDGLKRLSHQKANLGVRADDLLFRTVNRRERSDPRGQYVGADWTMADANIKDRKSVV